jgi:hypothetical protein
MPPARSFSPLHYGLVEALLDVDARIHAVDECAVDIGTAVNRVALTVLCPK